MTTEFLQRIRKEISVTQDTVREVIIGLSERVNRKVQTLKLHWRSAPPARHPGGGGLWRPRLLGRGPAAGLACGRHRDPGRPARGTEDGGVAIPRAATGVRMTCHPPVCEGGRSMTMGARAALVFVGMTLWCVCPFPVSSVGVAVSEAA